MSDMAAPRAETGLVSPVPSIPFAAALRVWARVALLSFGGPAGQIAVMHRILVEEKRWIGERQFLHALNFCMLLPGPEAQQLAIYIGWLLHRTKGGIVAGTLFVLPGFLSIMALSLVYVAAGDAGPVAGLFFGLKAAVLAVVLQAVVRLGRRALTSRAAVAIAAAAFVGIFVLDLPFPLIVLGAGLTGLIGTRWGAAWFRSAAHGDDGTPLLLPEHARPSLGWSLRVAAVCLVLWLGPVVVLVAAFGAENVFARLAVFFSQMAVVTFGGAYAVLAYVAQEAVQSYGWLAPGEMLDGLGMAETTPGPLIQVVQFVGFLAAFRDPGPLDPYLASVLASVLVSWVTFVPCFLWIFMGAPWIERLRGNAGLSGALGAITAAVVGVILNLALWFGLHVLFAEVWVWRGWGLALEVPVLASVDVPALVLTFAAMLAIFRFRAGLLPTLAGAATAGLAWGLAGGAV